MHFSCCYFSTIPSRLYFHTYCIHSPEFSRIYTSTATLVVMVRQKIQWMRYLVLIIYVYINAAQN